VAYIAYAGPAGAQVGAPKGEQYSGTKATGALGIDIKMLVEVRGWILEGKCIYI
jgi:hypothetical protein